MSLAECWISLIDVNFHTQKSLKFFDQNSADKNWSKNDEEIKVSPLMPIMVKPRLIVINRTGDQTIPTNKYRNIYVKRKPQLNMSFFCQAYTFRYVKFQFIENNLW